MLGLLRLCRRRGQASLKGFKLKLDPENRARMRIGPVLCESRPSVVAMVAVAAVVIEEETSVGQSGRLVGWCPWLTDVRARRDRGAL